ncbi:glycosyltransferase 61 family protein [Candidatus Dependentiae bacterium]|nr:glycosyltransferase 61 family protein [Candidatus Dependentiae bacterium]
MNSGGFQIGHWGFLLTDILAEMNGTRHFPKACELILTDSVATRHRLKQVKKVAKRSTYLHTSLALIENMTGTMFGISDQISRCKGPGFIIADALKIPTKWSKLGAYRAPEDAARDVLKCNGTASEDILIYNRQGSRTIVNHEEVAEYIKKLGLVVKVLFPEHLSPEEQICEMAKGRKLIITPHGGQQGSLIFKRTGVAVAIVSPEAHLLEYYRFFASENDPWYHIRGNRSWSCARNFCADSDGAWGNDGSCGIRCERRARGHSITLSLSALHRVLGEMGLIFVAPSDLNFSSS